MNGIEFLRVKNGDYEISLSHSSIYDRKFAFAYSAHRHQRDVSRPA